MEQASEPDEAGWPDNGGEPAAGQPGTAVQPGTTVQPGTAVQPGTGEPRVDAALRLLDRLPGLPVSDHPQLFEQVHAQLTDVLGELDSGTGGPAGARDS
jgi:hypothetical protein